MRLTQPPFPVAAQVRFLTNSGLYLHIPFCDSKCRYCSFYSLTANEDKKAEYTQALCREIEKRGGKLTRPFHSLYIGGGTPSALGSELLCEIIKTALDSFNFVEDAEITVEVNPKTGSEGLFASLKEAGVNRISMGIQSGNDKELKALGRAHTAKVARQAFCDARKAGFDNISVDLMIGLPDSNRRSLKKSLDFVLSLDPEHISTYILSIDEGTPLYDIRNTLKIPDEEETVRQYMQVCRALSKAGYEHYEISNFAKIGRRSRHNTNYWECGDYIGIGPAAHSFMLHQRFYYPADIEAFINEPKQEYDCAGGDMNEFIMLKLRLSDGISLKHLNHYYGFEPTEEFMKKVRLFEENKLCRFDGDNLALTEKGMLLSNEIIAELENCL